MVDAPRDGGLMTVLVGEAEQNSLAAYRDVRIVGVVLDHAVG